MFSAYTRAPAVKPQSPNAEAFFFLFLFFGGGGAGRLSVGRSLVQLSPLVCEEAE